LIPDDLRYTAEHEWIRVAGKGDDGGETVVRIGITDHAQSALGDVVHVELPEPGTAIEGGQPLGEVESTKSVADVYAPLTGTITARNAALVDTPELVNSDPYGDGWMVEIALSDPSALDGLLDPSAYAEHAANAG
jgi:glycine cleavage system H protein